MHKCIPKCSILTSPFSTLGWDSSEKLAHLSRVFTPTGETVQSQPLHQQPANILVLIQRRRLVSLLGQRTDHQCGNLPAAVLRVAVIRFIEHDDEQPVLLESWA